MNSEINVFSLNDNSKILQSIFENAVDGIFVINKRGIILKCNEAGAHLFGYDQNELLGRNISMLMPEPHQSSHDGYLNHHLETGHTKIIGKGREEFGLRKNGHLFPMRLGVSKVELDGEPYFAGIIHDLTHLRKAQEDVITLNQALEKKVEERTEQLKEKNEILNQEIRERQEIEIQLLANQQELKLSLEKEKELNELKSRFVSMASHEFRTPLSTILSSAGLIVRYPAADQQAQRQKHVSRIKSAVEMLSGILNDFLSLAKVEEGQLTLKIETFDFIDLGHEIIEELKHSTKDGQTILMEGEAGPFMLQQDRSLIKNMIYNLLSNAIKYSKEGQTIGLKYKSEDHGNALIEISDEGIGVPLQDQAHLFTRFFRAKNAINIQGTGLGLNIVRHYAQQLGGVVSFSSKEGKGSSFYISLPKRYLNPDK
jgi:two-component system, LuxR family, sensor kinase FixL